MQGPANYQQARRRLGQIDMSSEAWLSKPHVQIAREKCTQSLQLYCFVSVTLTYVLRDRLSSPGLKRLRHLIKFHNIF